MVSGAPVARLLTSLELDGLDVWASNDEMASTGKNREHSLVRAPGGERTKGLYGSCANIPTERDPIREATISVAWRYSWAILTRRARRAGVSALCASSKQHSANLSNCVTKSLLMVREQYRHLRLVPPTRVCEPALSREATNGQGVIGLCTRCARPLGPSAGTAALRASRSKGKKAAIQHAWLCPLTDKVEQILARADWMLPELLTGRRITRLLGTVM
jgi:hypothetical protein